MSVATGAHRPPPAAADPPVADHASRLPTFIVIGAMKCGTSALHSLLGEHPDIGVAAEKEVNFFVGPAAPPGAHRSGHVGQWWRGPAWYADRFPATPARGEASPAYTSPSYPEAAARISATVPEARLIYMIRDPLERAVSQYRHHRRDGTERRALGEALLDPDSQYVSRSRYRERLEPFIDIFGAAQIAIVAQETLRRRPAAVLAELDRFLGVDPDARSPTDPVGTTATNRRPAAVPASIRARFTELVAEDLGRLRQLGSADRALAEIEARRA